VQLAEAIRVNPRNITGLVDALVEGGFVTREPHPTDRRSILVTLTAHRETVMESTERDYQALPHAVGPEGLRIRHGDELEIVLGWDDIASVAPLVERTDGAKTFRHDSDLLAIAVQEETNIEVELERATTVRVRSNESSIRVVRLRADDPKGYLAEVRTHLREWEQLRATE
jgi:DNA-binding MarR family transcriptional regulator